MHARCGSAQRAGASNGAPPASQEPHLCHSARRNRAPASRRTIWSQRRRTRSSSPRRRPTFPIRTSPASSPDWMAAIWRSAANAEWIRSSRAPRPFRPRIWARDATSCSSAASPIRASPARRNRQSVNISATSASATTPPTRTCASTTSTMSKFSKGRRARSMAQARWAASSMSCDGSRARGSGAGRGGGAALATRAGRRSMRQLVALTRTARASEPSSRRWIAFSTLIRPRTGLTRACQSFASPTLILTPACRLISGSAADRLPFGTSNARSSPASSCVGRHSAIAATARERRGCMVSGSISSHHLAARPSSPTGRRGRRSCGRGSCR